MWLPIGEIPTISAKALAAAIPLKAPFLDLLRSRKKFLLSGHEHPDGDCVGAQVALYHLIRAMKGDVCIVNPDPIGRSLRFL